MKFCKNCGHELRPEAKVCTNCGQKVEAANEENNQPTRQAAPREPMDPKKKKRIMIIAAGAAVLALVLFVTYSVIASSLSPSNQLDTIAEAVSEEDAEALKSAVDNDITVEEAEAYITYVDQVSGFSQYNSWVSDVKSALDNGAPGSEIFDGMYTLLSANRDGSQYLIFDDYSFTIPRTNVYISDQYDIDEFVYTMDETEHRWNSENDKFAELIPGIYNFEGSAIIDEESYNSSMTVNFNNNEMAVLEPGFFYLNISEYVTSMYFEDVTEENVTVNINDEAVDVDLNDYDNRIGPYQFDEELNLNATVEHAGETFESDNGPIQLSADEVDMDYGTGGAAPVHFVELEFDDDAIYDAGETARNEAQMEEERETFEADMEEHVESFVTDYLYALEMMYMFEDINEVDDYMDQETEAYAALENNIENGTFEGMYITNISFSNYTRNGETITIDVESDREYDALESRTEFNTRYTIGYDPDELELEVTGFQDL